MKIEKHTRQFLPKDFKVTTWEALKPFFENLKSRNVNSADELKQWFRDRSELESAISEDMGWRYIRMTGNTANKEFVDSFNYFIAEIQPHIEPYSNDLNEKALGSPFLKEMNDPGYAILIRSLKKEHE